MPETEPITIKKFFSGIGNPLNFLKLGAQGINLSLIALIIFGTIFLKNYFFPKKSVPTQTQTSSVVFDKDSGVSTVNIVNQQKQNEQKKTVGLEASISSKDSGLGFVKYLGDNDAVVLGIRYTFKKVDDKTEILPEIKYRHDF